MKAVLPTLPAVPVVIAICLIINVTSTVQAQTGGDEGQVRTVSAEQPPLIEPLQSSPDLDFKSLLRPRFSLRADASASLGRRRCICGRFAGRWGE